MSEEAPAKINLALHVVGKRPDGFHLLESLVLFTRFGDRLTVETAQEDSVSIDGPFGEKLVADGDNLVVRARDLLRAAYPQASAPVAIRLTKNLPIASGIGGGSSDAAATLKALNRLHGLNLSNQKLTEIGAQLGADVPMCIRALPLVARGIGDDIELVDNVPGVPLVLVNPGRPVSTAAVFAELETTDNGPLPPLPPLPKAFDFHSLRNWLELTRNDLQAPAMRIDGSIAHALRTLDREKSGFSRMSGSGATCFGLFETNNVAKRAAAEIRQRNPHWFVATTRALPSQDVT